MGLLDDAIRDHLELKRRRGADPTEVAREQHEALDPLEVSVEEPDLDSQAESLGSADKERVEGEPHELTGTSEQHPEVEAEHVAQVGQETAELDMQAVLGEDVDSSLAADELAADQTHQPGSQAPVGEDLLEWEMPSRPDGEPQVGPERSDRYEQATEQHEVAVSPSAWDLSGADEQPPREIPGQERMSFE